MKVMKVLPSWILFVLAFVGGSTNVNAKEIIELSRSKLTPDQIWEKNILYQAQYPNKSDFVAQVEKVGEEGLKLPAIRTKVVGPPAQKVTVTYKETTTPGVYERADEMPLSLVTGPLEKKIKSLQSEKSVLRKTLTNERRKLASLREAAMRAENRFQEVSRKFAEEKSAWETVKQVMQETLHALNRQITSLQGELSGEKVAKSGLEQEVITLHDTLDTERTYFSEKFDFLFKVIYALVGFGLFIIASTGFLFIRFRKQRESAKASVLQIDKAETKEFFSFHIPKHWTHGSGRSIIPLEIVSHDEDGCGLIRIHGSRNLVKAAQTNVVRAISKHPEENGFTVPPLASVADLAGVAI